MRTSLHKIYVADFETRAGEAAEAEALTWVWAWALTSIYDFETVEVGTDIDSFMLYCQTVIKSGIVYFHNLKFDGNFLVSWFLSNGFEHDNELMLPGQFSTLVSDSGTFYTVKVTFDGRSIIEFRDSYKKAPFGLAKLGEDFKTKYQKLDLEYTIDRPPNHSITPEEQEYIKNDVRVIAEVLQRLYNSGMNKMTIGSDALATLKEFLGGEENFRKIFPILDHQEDYYARRSFRGGWCYNNPKYKGKYLEIPGEVYDVVSLYPSMMHSNRYLLDGVMQQNLYPYGVGEYYNGQYIEDEQYPLYIQRFTAYFKLKPGHVPTVQLKQNSLFRANEYVTDSKEPVEMYMTNVDLELFFKHYNVLEIEYHSGYKYRGYAGFFDKYIDKFFKDKCDGEGAVKQEAKLQLNNMYGKFVQRVEAKNKIPYLKDGIVRWETVDSNTRDPIYVPVGAFTTSYARRFTITAAQTNYKIFAYSDTDSIHCFGKVKGIVTGSNKLQVWEKESEFTAAKFVRQKTYAELIDGEWNIKCAGMNQASKDEFLRMIEDGEATMEDFKVGLEIKGKKLKPKAVRNGIILYPTDFTLRG